METAIIKLQDKYIEITAKKVGRGVKLTHKILNNKEVKEELGFKPVKLK